MGGRVASQISGATLGYIAGNTRGAIKGFKAGGSLYDMKRRYSQSSRSPRYGRTAVKRRKFAYSGSSSKKKTSTTNPSLVTGENDWGTLYNRRRMPRGKRRRWVRFVRKTQAVISKALAPSFFVITRNAVIESVVDKQVASSLHTVLGGYSLDTATQDISVLAARVDAISNNPASTYTSERFQITGWLAETQVVADIGNTTPAYIDMYYWKCKRNYPKLTGFPSNASFLNMWDYDLLTQGVNANAGGSSLAFNDYGVTPFQTNSFPKYVNIYKKRRVRLSPGGTVQIEQRSGRNYYVNNDYVQNLGLVQNMTEGIFFIVYGTPSATSNVAASVKVRLSSNFNYTYRLMQSSKVTGGTTAP